MSNAEIFAYAAGAAVLAVLITVVFARLYRRPDLRSRNDARERIGQPETRLTMHSFTEEEQEMIRAAQPGFKSQPRVAGKHPGLSAPYRGSAPSPTPAPDPYFDNPILNPIHPLHSAFVPPAPSPSYDPPSPCPAPSYDSGSPSSCDSPSPSVSS